MSARRVGDAAGYVALAAMLLTPFGRRGGRFRRVLTGVTVVAGAARSVAVDVREHDRRRALSVAAATAAMTWLAEAVGVRTGRLFGRYAYTPSLRPQMGGVPLLVPLAWVAMAAPAHAATEEIASSRAGRVVGGAAALTAWDLFLDPQMVGEGYWRWSGGGRYHGVPWTNYAGWMGVSAAVMAVRELGLGGQRTRPVGRDHVTTYRTVAVMETLAFATFLRDGVVALVGGATMLPLAFADQSK